MCVSLNDANGEYISQGTGEDIMSKHTRNIERLAETEKIRYLKQCCKDGLHAWGNSASPEYEKCTRSWCDVVRKKEARKENATTDTKQRTDDN